MPEIEPATGEYAIVVALPDLLGTANDLRRDLQEAYDNGVAGCFGILADNALSLVDWSVVFYRSTHDDAGLLLQRIGWEALAIDQAAVEQLKSELKTASDSEHVAKVIAALGNPEDVRVVGLKREDVDLGYEPDDVVDWRPQEAFDINDFYPQCRKARAAGHAICTFNPEELGQASPAAVEEAMCKAGWAAIDAANPEQGT